MNQDTNDPDAVGGAAKAPLTDPARVPQRLMAGSGASMPAAAPAARADLLEPLDAALAAPMREDA